MNKFNFLFSLSFILLISSNTYSQWSNDPNTNLPVCVQAGDQALPKVAVTSDGGCYISWFDNRSGSYAVYLQRLNVNGQPQFAANGLLISSNPQSSSLVDYDMITDDSSNCIIAFTDTRAGGQINPYIYKISPAGTFLWGANGISLNSQTSVFQANPKLAKCTGNNIFVTWIYASSPRVAKIQRLSPGGAKQFTADGISISGTGSESIDFPSVVASDNGNAIMMFVGYTGTFISPQNYRIYTQKFSPAGSSVWNANCDTVYGTGFGQAFNPPYIYSDGNNGALYAWYDSRTGSSTCYVQRFTSTGTKLFPANGSAGNTTPGMVRNTMQACVMTSTNETYLFWKEANGTQSQFGLYGQRFNAAGTRLWGEAGLEVIPLSSNSFVTCVTQSADTNVYLYINDGVFGSSNNIIKAAKFNRSGTNAWNGGALMTVGGAAGPKLRLDAKINFNPVNRMSILAWSDQRSSTPDIYAQNINNNGTLGGTIGVQQISPEVPEGFEMKQNYPNPFNPVTKIVYSLKTNEYVFLKIYDALGKEVLSVSNGLQNAGTYSYDFNASNLSSGVYYYEIQAGEFRDVKKMILNK